MILARPRRTRHGFYGLLILAVGGLVYLLVRDPVPLLGGSSILHVRPLWWLGSLPTAVHGAAVVFGASWAIRGATRRQLVGLPASVVILIELSQVVGPLAGWGTFDPADLLLGLTAVVVVATWLAGTRLRSGGRPSGGVRLVLVGLIAVVGAAASSSPTADFEVSFSEPTLTHVDAYTTIVVVTGLVTAGPAKLIKFPSPFFVYDADFDLSFGECETLNANAAGCQYTATRSEKARLAGVDSVMMTVNVQATSQRGAIILGRQHIEVTFIPGTTNQDVQGTSVTEGSTPRPVCGEVAPQQVSYLLGVGQLVDEVLVETFLTSSHTRAGRTVVLAAEGPGTLLVGLIIDLRAHDPCVDGRINNFTYRVEVSGREGDRGNVAVRPTLFVEDKVLIAAPLLVVNGTGVNDVVELTPADFGPLQGGGTLDLVSGPPVRFGLVVGVSCPETSTCGAIERAVTVDMLEVAVNEAVGAP